MRQPQCEIIENDVKVTVGIFMLYFFKTRSNEAYIANVPFKISARTFICFPEFSFSLKKSIDFVFLIFAFFAHSCKSVVYFTSFFLKCIHIKISIKSTFKINSNQLS